MKAVILAGGNGTRLKKYNHEVTGVPKPMLKLGDMPLLEIVTRQLAKHSFDDIIISTGQLSKVIEDYFTNPENIPERVKIKFSKQEPLLGTVGPLSIIPNLNEPVLVMHGDILTNLDFSKFWQFHNNKKAVLTLATKSLKLPAVGIIETEGEFIKGYYERASESYLDSMSIFILGPPALKHLKKGVFFNLDRFINLLIENNEKVVAYRTDEFFKDIGTDEDYEQANEIFVKNKPLFLSI